MLYGLAQLSVAVTDDGISLTVSGESMGWTYGAEMDLLAGDLTGATVTLGSAGLGSLTLVY